jgi:hypothetical protein
VALHQFLDLKTIEVDYRRYAHNVSAWRVARLRHDTVILSQIIPEGSALFARDAE